MTLAGLEAIELRTALETEREARLALDRHLAETAHDVRAALAAIVGYARMLDDPRQDALTGQQIAHRIERLASNLCEVSGDLLGRRAASMASPRPARRRFSVLALLTTCAQAVEPRCREKGLVLRLEVPAERTFIGDASSIGRIAHNLLTNAVRYTERGEVGLRGAIDAGGLRLEVWDTGIGIATDDFERIFGEFCRLGRARRLEPLGTGLGLATVKSLCARIHARIEVESTLGAGSVFRVRVPARPRRRVRSAPRQPELFDS